MKPPEFNSLSSFIQKIENCYAKSKLTVDSIKNIIDNIANTSSMRAIEVEQTVKVYEMKYNEAQSNIKSLIECGKFVRAERFPSSSTCQKKAASLEK